MVKNALSMVRTNTDVEPSDGSAQKFPISVKGVIFLDDGIPLLKNERDEWELPGGKIETGEQPRYCLAREIEEELCVSVIVGPILDTWMYNVLDKTDVLIVTYLCFPNQGNPTLKISHEHKELGVFTRKQIASLNMPDGYKESINRANSALGFE